MTRIIFAAVYSAALTLGACASAPPYALAPSANAAGYSEQQIEDDRWRVSYTGTTRMSAGEVQDFALMRAAQLTLERGGDWFEVVTSDTDADAKNRYSVETDYDTRYVVQRSCGVLGCTERLVPVWMRTEHERVDERTVYHHTMEIRLRSGEKTTGATDAYDAQDTFATLRSRLS